MSKTEIIEQAMHIDAKNGTSEWWSISLLEKTVGFSLGGNGSAYFQSDRGLGKRYVIEKNRDKGNRLSYVRTVGFAYYHQVERSSKIPLEVKKWLRGFPCSMCGTTADITFDHKDGNKQPIEYPNKDDFQTLCRHCNAVKREICKKCSGTSVRFDAKSLGYQISWTEGTERFQPMHPRCFGCYWYSPFTFRGKLTLNLVKNIKDKEV